MLLLSVHILFLSEKFGLYSISSELYILYQVAQMSIKNVRHLFPKNTSPETFDPFILRLNLPLLRWLGLTFRNGSLNKSFFPYTFLEDINLPYTFFHSTSRFRYLQWYLTHTHTHTHTHTLWEPHFSFFARSMIDFAISLVQSFFPTFKIKWSVLP